jgi:hypothetical protein
MAMENDDPGRRAVEPAVPPGWPDDAELPVAGWGDVAMPIDELWDAFGDVQRTVGMHLDHAVVAEDALLRDLHEALVARTQLVRGERLQLRRRSGNERPASSNCVWPFHIRPPCQLTPILKPCVPILARQD